MGLLLIKMITCRIFMFRAACVCLGEGEGGKLVFVTLNALIFMMCVSLLIKKASFRGYASSRVMTQFLLL